MTATNSNQTAKYQKEVEKTKQSGDKNSEKVDNFKFSFMMLVCVGVLVWIVLSWIEMYNNWDLLRKYNMHETFKDLPWIILGFLNSFVLYWIAADPLQRFWIGFLTEKNTRENENHSDRLARIKSYTSGIVYYTFSLIVGCYVAHKESILPILYGGTLDIKTHYISQWPKPNSQTLKIFQLFTYGHHIERIIHHIIHSWNTNSFYIMFLHHIMTVGLILISFHFEYNYFALVIIILNDQSDIFLNLFRLTRETKFKALTAFFAVCLAFSWFFSRIISLNWEALYPVIYLLNQFTKTKPFLISLPISHNFILISLVLLSILNLFWMFQIICYFYTLYIKKKEKFDYEDEDVNKKN